jgi:CheY-like chemotaxis protein
MTPDPAPGRPLIPSEPLILLANGDQVFRDTIETVLVASGFRVIQVDNGPRTLEQARRHQPDGVLLDITFSPQWPDAYAVCRALRAPPDPIISPAVPLILTTAGPVLRAQQLEALRQGAWELRGDPLDMEELSLRLAAYVQGKLESDRVRGEGLLDRASGLYNASGVARRAEELAAYAARQGVALGCAMFAPAAPLEEPEAADRLAAAFRRVGRMSDAIGRTGPAEFTVFAPATDAQGVAGLVARMRAGVSELFETGNGHSFTLRAGASAEPASKRMSPRDLWSRARRALDGEAAR